MISGLLLHVAQHRGASARVHEMGKREIIRWSSEAGVLLDQG